MGYFVPGVSDVRMAHASRSTMGTITTGGGGTFRIANSARRTVGFLEICGNNWRVENTGRSTIGYITDQGRVEDAARSTLGYAPDLPPAWVAVHFFFFRFPQRRAVTGVRLETCPNVLPDQGTARLLQDRTSIHRERPHCRPPLGSTEGGRPWRRTGRAA